MDAGDCVCVCVRERGADAILREATPINHAGEGDEGVGFEMDDDEDYR